MWLDVAVNDLAIARVEIDECIKQLISPGDYLFTRKGSGLLRNAVGAVLGCEILVLAVVVLLEWRRRPRRAASGGALASASNEGRHSAVASTAPSGVGTDGTDLDDELADGIGQDDSPARTDRMLPLGRG